MRDIDYMISVMQAYRDGKKIEYHGTIYEKWIDVVGDPVWNWLDFDYRVKLGTHKKIVPYESAEEFLAAQKEHGMYIHIKDAIRDAYVLPMAIKDEGVYFTKDEGLVLYSSLLSMFHTWQDGTRVGKEVEV